jgi:hypothetical protein
MVLKIVIKKGKRKLQDRESYCVFWNIFGSWDVKKSFFIMAMEKEVWKKNFFFIITVMAL